MVMAANTAEMRDGAIKHIREELGKVDKALETYVPEAVLLEGSSLTIRIAFEEFTTVDADFRHLA